MLVVAVGVVVVAVVVAFGLSSKDLLDFLSRMFALGEFILLPPLTIVLVDQDCLVDVGISLMSFLFLESRLEAGLVVSVLGFLRFC